eukprot:2409133-Rhodomonas_salina.2
MARATHKMTDLVGPGLGGGLVVAEAAVLEARGRGRLVGGVGVHGLHVRALLAGSQPLAPLLVQLPRVLVPARLELRHQPLARGARRRRVRAPQVAQLLLEALRHPRQHLPEDQFLPRPRRHVSKPLPHHLFLISSRV